MAIGKTRMLGEFMAVMLGGSNVAQHAQQTMPHDEAAFSQMKV